MTTEVKTPERIMSEMQLRQMQLNPQLIDYSPYSPNNVINEAMAIQCYILLQLVAQKEIDLNPNTALGDALDALVIDRQITRLSGTKATGYVRMWRDTAAGFDIEIPEGTIVARISDSGEVVQFRTSADATLSTGTTEITVPIIASETGVAFNVPAYTIDRFIGSVPGIHHVENQLPIEGGTDQESDEDLLDRYIHVASTTGKATIEMIQENLEALEVDDAKIVREAKVFDIGAGDIEVVVDPVNRTDPEDDIWYCIRDTKAAGVTACGITAAALRPSASVYDMDDAAGGDIWVRCADVVNSTKILSITYIDILGNTKTATVTIVEPGRRGAAFKATLEDTYKATRVISSDYDDVGSFDIMIGLGEYPYMYTIPEEVVVQVVINVRYTETPEEDLADLIEASIAAKLGSYKSGEKLEYSDIYKYCFFDFIDGTIFSGINTIVSFAMTCKGTSLDKNGDEVVLENDERIKAGSIDIIEVA